MGPTSQSSALPDAGNSPAGPLQPLLGAGAAPPSSRRRPGRCRCFPIVSAQPPSCCRRAGPPGSRPSTGVREAGAPSARWPPPRSAWQAWLGCRRKQCMQRCPVGFWGGQRRRRRQRRRRIRQGVAPWLQGTRPGCRPVSLQQLWRRVSCCSMRTGSALQSLAPPLDAARSFTPVRAEPLAISYIACAASPSPS